MKNIFEFCRVQKKPDEGSLEMIIEFKNVLNMGGGMKSQYMDHLIETIGKELVKEMGPDVRELLTRSKDEAVKLLSEKMANAAFYRAVENQMQETIVRLSSIRAAHIIVDEINGLKK